MHEGMSKSVKERWVGKMNSIIACVEAVVVREVVYV